MEKIIEFLNENLYRKVQQSDDKRYLYAESSLGSALSFRLNKSGSIQLSIDGEVIISADADFIITTIKNIC